MSRSRRHTPVFGCTLTDDMQHPWKHMAQRKWRRLVRQVINAGRETLPLLREVSDVWGWPMDGKWYCRPHLLDPKWMRK